MPAEKQLEQRVRKLCKQSGVLCYKFVSPGCDGVPDRILVFPDGNVAFVELKALGKRLRPLQAYRLNELISNNAEAVWFDNYRDFEQWFVTKL